MDAAPRRAVLHDRPAGLRLERALQDRRDAADEAGHLQGGARPHVGKVAGLFTIFDARGEQLDQGTLLRYLNEMAWFPTAFLGDNIAWQAVDDHSADVTFTDGDKSVSARMTFDDAGGPPISRPALPRNKALYARHLVHALDQYGLLAGLNLPVRGQAVWRLPGGDLPYAELELI